MKQPIVKDQKFYSTIGEKGGKVTSKKKSRASKKNGRKGGRPRKV